MGRQLVTTSMTSRNYVVIIVTSQSSKSSHWKLGPGSTIRVDPLSISFNKVLKIRSCGLEFWEKNHLARAYSDQNSTITMT